MPSSSEQSVVFKSPAITRARRLRLHRRIPTVAHMPIQRHPSLWKRRAGKRCTRPFESLEQRR
eukprot:368435-Lingulodinium_polyedra.AAC.1